MAKFISTGDKERKLNLKRNKFLEMVRRFPGVSRQTIAETLRISTFNISHLTRDLIQEQVVLEKDDPKNEPQGQGRPSKPLYINGQFDYFAGVDLEASCWRMVIIDFEGQTVFEHEEEFIEATSAEGYISQLSENLKTAIDKSGELWDKVSCLAFGAPGSLDRETGTVLRFEILPHFENIPVLDLYKEITKKEVVLSDNISNLAVYDQWTRSEAADKTVLHFAIRSGIKTILVNHDELYIGKNNYSGEIGFLPLEFGNPNSPNLHSAISQKSLKQKLPSIDSKFWEGDSETVNAVFNNSDHQVVLNEFSKVLAASLKSMIYLYDPDEVVVHSSLFKSPNLLWDKVMEKFNQQIEERYFAPPPVTASEEPANSAAIGAAFRALHNMYPTN